MFSISRVQMINQTVIVQKFFTLRDRARLQAHRFSLDAHHAWRVLEEEVTSLEDQLLRSGDTAVAPAAGKVTKLIERVETFLDQNVGVPLSLDIARSAHHEV